LLGHLLILAADLIFSDNNRHVACLIFIVTDLPLLNMVDQLGVFCFEVLIGGTRVIAWESH